jgi:hypothetical protein
MSILTLNDENIATTINNQYIKMEQLAIAGKYDLAIEARDTIERYYNYFLMNHPEPFSPTLLDSNRISCPDSLSREFSYRNH